jgi:uncharacterized repeat protein (TIGR01451 family)
VSSLVIASLWVSSQSSKNEGEGENHDVKIYQAEILNFNETHGPNFLVYGVSAYGFECDVRNTGNAPIQNLTITGNLSVGANESSDSFTSQIDSLAINETQHVVENVEIHGIDNIRALFLNQTWSLKLETAKEVLDEQTYFMPPPKLT